MRKLIFSLSALALLASCSGDNDNNVPAEGKGSITLRPTLSLDVNLIHTREAITDFTDYKLILVDGETTLSYDCSAEGTVEDIPAGTYTATLTNFHDDFTPAFDAAKYSGTGSVTVVGGEDKPFTPTLTQANAGVYFNYEFLAGTAIEDVVPTVEQDGTSLVFEGENKLAKGYFAPGEATVSMKVGDTIITISGEDSATLELGAKDLLYITLRASASTDGTISIVADIDDNTNPRDEDIVLDKPAEGNELLTFTSASSTITYALLGAGKHYITFILQAPGNVQANVNCTYNTGDLTDGGGLPEVTFTWNGGNTGDNYIYDNFKITGLAEEGYISYVPYTGYDTFMKIEKIETGYRLSGTFSVNSAANISAGEPPIVYDISYEGDIALTYKSFPTY